MKIKSLEIVVYGKNREKEEELLWFTKPRHSTSHLEAVGRCTENRWRWVTRGQHGRCRVLGRRTADSEMGGVAGVGEEGEKGVWLHVR